MDEFQRQRIFLRAWLHGKGYFTAIEAMNFAEPLHNGTRKDGVTPEFQHQVEIALHISVLPNLVDPEATIATGILHDTPEDKNVSHAELVRRFGHKIADSTDRVNKYDPDGSPRDEAKLYEDMALCPVSSIVKGVDRGHNQRNMGGVFSEEKMHSYLDFTDRRILPMLKQARGHFPQQYAAYQNVRHLLTTQARLVRSCVLLKAA